jgi:betaine-aldehyde dehydrogenase
MVQNEVFGPVISIQRFSDEAEALLGVGSLVLGVVLMIWAGHLGEGPRLVRHRAVQRA